MFRRISSKHFMNDVASRIRPITPVFPGIRFQESACLQNKWEKPSGLLAGSSHLSQDEPSFLLAQEQLCEGKGLQFTPWAVGLTCSKGRSSAPGAPRTSASPTPHRTPPTHESALRGLWLNVSYKKRCLCSNMFTCLSPG